MICVNPYIVTRHNRLHCQVCKESDDKTVWRLASGDIVLTYDDPFVNNHLECKPEWDTRDYLHNPA